jgi:hypothetical protein
VITCCYDFMDILRASAPPREPIADFILENAVENHFTAKPPRAQRTYSKIKLHPFDEAIDHLDFDGSSGFCVGMFIPSHGMRLSPPQKNMMAIPNVSAFR